MKLKHAYYDALCSARADMKELYTWDEFDADMILAVIDRNITNLDNFSKSKNALTPYELDTWMLSEKRIDGARGYTDGCTRTSQRLTQLIENRPELFEPNTPFVQGLSRKSNGNTEGEFSSLNIETKN